jgi:hypothetical protein
MLTLFIETIQCNENASHDGSWNNKMNLKTQSSLVGWLVGWLVGCVFFSPVILSILDILPGPSIPFHPDLATHIEKGLFVILHSSRCIIPFYASPVYTTQELKCALKGILRVKA